MLPPVHCVSFLISQPKRVYTFTAFRLGIEIWTGYQVIYSTVLYSTYSYVNCSIY